MTAQIVADLKTSILSDRRPLIVCGAGASTFSTGGNAPSWKSFVAGGVDRVADLRLSPLSWSPYAQSLLASGSSDDLIRVADDVTRYLGGHGGGEFAEWLDEDFGNLVVSDTSLYDAIFDLDCPVATTNYDTLLSDHSGLPGISWQSTDRAIAFFKGQTRAVLHLHGVWNEPSTVILGRESYDRLLADRRRGFAQQFGALLRPVLFVGCSSDGINDPDFSQLKEFVGEWSRSVERMYWLVRSNPGTELPLPDAVSRLFPIGFGAEFHDLPQFISNLRGKLPSQPQSATNHILTIDQVYPKPLVLGRERDVALLARAVLAGKNAVISGGPGVGKTALATAILYLDEIRELFGERRVFVSLDGEQDAGALATGLAKALGIEAAADLPSLLRQLELAARDGPVLAILDNAEDIFEAGFEEAERVSRLIGQITGLGIIITVRGIGPDLPNSQDIQNLSRLDETAAKQCFLGISGLHLQGDPHLDQLLKALDGHALSIQLMAAQAKGLQNLQTISAKWQEQRAEMLRRKTGAEGRLTSVRASLALSLDVPAIKQDPLAKRLLGVLSELPDGTTVDDAKKMLSSRTTTVDKRRAQQAIDVLDRFRLVENRSDTRIRMLNPLREAVRIDRGIAQNDRKALVARYSALALRAENIDRKDFDEVRSYIDPDAGNFESIFLMALASDGPSNELRRAMMAYLTYVAQTNRPIGEMWEFVAKQFASEDDFKGAAILLIHVVNQLIGRGYHQRGLSALSLAEPYVRQVNDHIVKGNSFFFKARALMYLSQHDAAET